jgi:type II secretory pathway component GspD/PulD (secretin)
LLAKIIDSIDEKVKQAVIEVKLVEINRQSLKNLGINLEEYKVDVSDIGRLPSNYALPATLDFLEQEQKAKVLASPRIRALHGKKASINIGEVIPVPYYRYENASNTYLGYTPQVYKEYRDVQVGIRLEVTPEITRDNEISMELNTTVDSVLDINEDGQIHKTERKTETFVRIKNGETVVLGGLINHQDSDTRKSPSLLNKVPLLKGLLSHTKYDSRNSEMIMLVTPRLVNLDYYEGQPEKLQQGLIMAKDDYNSQNY